MLHERCACSSWLVTEAPGVCNIDRVCSATGVRTSVVGSRSCTHSRARVAATCQWRECRLRDGLHGVAAWTDDVYLTRPVLRMEFAERQHTHDRKRSWNRINSRGTHVCLCGNGTNHIARRRVRGGWSGWTAGVDGTGCENFTSLGRRYVYCALRLRCGPRFFGECLHDVAVREFNRIAQKTRNVNNEPGPVAHLNECAWLRHSKSRL